MKTGLNSKNSISEEKNESGIRLRSGFTFAPPQRTRPANSRKEVEMLQKRVSELENRVATLEEALRKNQTQPQQNLVRPISKITPKNPKFTFCDELSCLALTILAGVALNGSFYLCLRYILF